MANKQNITSEVLNAEAEKYLNLKFDIKNTDKYLKLMKEFDEYRISTIENPKLKNSLNEISKLKSYLNDGYKAETKKYVEAGDISKAADIIIDAVQIDSVNVELADFVMDAYMQKELYTECIELYKMMFVSSSNPIYFEKIGDIYIKKEDYENALDSYLSCAEISEGYSQIYRKLADIFGKINDETSRQACLEQIDIIEGKNGR